ncbi:hypothetical protein IG631_13302 [Alternaria alternata]|nr:hypothetical protein IG631_13302 [Alternaria alternata]
MEFQCLERLQEVFQRRFVILAILSDAPNIGRKHKALLGLQVHKVSELALVPKGGGIFFSEVCRIKEDHALQRSPFLEQCSPDSV